MSTLDLLAGPVVEPRLDQGRAEVARLVNAARATLLSSGTAVTVDLLARSRGASVAAVRQWVSRRRRGSELVTVIHDGIALIPTFQLDDAFDLEPDAARAVRRLVGYGMTGWAVWDWAQTPNGWLDGDVPADLLATGDIDRVMHAIDGLTQV